ncbi:MAG: carotenoid biosynthesis protein [Actinomycetota bacterium]|nr:carotenoid biosynthesis protein [Actinomycetota bacterium]
MSPVPAGLAGLTILLEIAYPLLSGTTRTALTVVTVLTFFAASVSHAVVSRGVRWALLLVVLTAGGGLLAEAVGTRYGVPFGAYTYADSLGRKAFGVPLVIPLAWTMMAYPALLVGRRLCRSWALGSVVAGVALASWDLFLDPQMVEAGHWRWAHPSPALPGVPGIPASNFAGWLAVSVAMMALLWRLLPDRGRELDDRVPSALYLWTYASSVLANLAFFHRPGVALVGAVGMGVVAVPFARSLRDRRHAWA